jgi:predicted nucleotidyltransferase
MASVVNKMKIKDLIHPPKWLAHNMAYETIMGSMAYGVNLDDSDMDVYGFCIPPKHILFPHLEGVIKGFGNQGEIFEQWQEHHIIDKETKKEYDFTIYNISKYFQLLMENNPNMIDSIFTPRECVLHSTNISEYLRDTRKEFLHKGSWHKYKGYAYAQLSKINKGNNKSNPKRQESIDKFGFDTKFAYHVVRLVSQAEQIIMEGDLDLRKNNEHYKAIRRGEVSLEEITAWFQDKEKTLEKAYVESKIPHSPDEKRLKEILVNCLEMHYGSLDAMMKIDRDYGGLMALYVKKAVVVDAKVFPGITLETIKELEEFDDWFTDQLKVATNVSDEPKYKGQSLLIPTLEGVMEASAGDFIIQGVENELYPCKPAIFWKTYEPISKDSE